MNYKNISILLGEQSKYSITYINIIRKAHDRQRVINPKIYENHHILPKSIFPKYKSLIKHKWNSVLLTFKEHYICHLLIYKHYKSIFKKNEFKKMAYAILGVKNSTGYAKNRINAIKLNTVIINKEWLQNELKTKNLTLIVEESKYSKYLLTKCIKEYNLIQYVKYGKVRDGREGDKFDIDKEWLQNELKTKTISEIATNNFSVRVIRNRIKRWNLILV